MSITDRLRHRQMTLSQEQAAGESLTDSPSSLALAEPDHIRRMKAVVSVLQTYISKNDPTGNYARLAFIMSTMADELSEELRDYDEIKFRIFMFQIGEVISWIGHGDNERLPEAIKEFANQAMGGDSANTNG